MNEYQVHCRCGQAYYFEADYLDEEGEKLVREGLFKCMRCDSANMYLDVVEAADDSVP